MSYKRLPMRDYRIIVEAFRLMPDARNNETALSEMERMCSKASDYTGSVWLFPEGAKLTRHKDNGRWVLDLYGYAADKSDVNAAYKYMECARNLRNAVLLMTELESRKVPAFRRTFTGFAWTKKTGVSETERPGVEAAAAWVEKRADDFCNVFGSRDPDTGDLSFGTGDAGLRKHEYFSELQEIADGIRHL